MEIVQNNHWWNIRNKYFGNACGISVMVGIAGAVLALQVTSFTAIVIIGLLALFAICLNPKIRLFMLIFSFPLEVVSYYHGITIKLWMIILAIGIAFWIVDILKGRKGIVDDLLIPILGIILIVELISIVNAVNDGRWLRMVVQYSILFGLSVYIASILDSRERIRFALNATIVTGMVLSLYGVIQWLAALQGIDLKLPIEHLPIYPPEMSSHLVSWGVAIGGVWVARIRGTFPDPTFYGGYILSFFPLVLSIGFYSLFTKKHVFLALMATLLSLAAVIGAFSRSTTIGLLLAVLIVLGYWYRIFRKKYVVKTCIVSLVVYVFAMIVLPSRIGNILNPVTLIGRMQQTAATNDVSTTNHRQLARGALNIWQKYPIIGGGFGNFGSQLGHTANAMSHSALLSILSETGILGVMAHGLLILYLVLLIKNDITLHDPFGYQYALSVGVLASLIATLSGNVTYHYYNQPFIWFLIGLIVAITRSNRKHLASAGIYQ